MEINVGHFLVHSLLTELGVKEIIDILASQMRFQFRIYDMIAQLIYARIINPCSKSKTVSAVLPHLYNGIFMSEDQVYDGSYSACYSSLHIFKQKSFRRRFRIYLILQYSFYLEKKCSSCICKSISITCKTKWLARKSCQQIIEIRYILICINQGYIAIDFFFPIKVFICLDGVWLNLGRKYTLCFKSQLLHGLLKPKPYSS